MVSALAPNRARMGRRKNRESAPKMTENTSPSTRTCPMTRAAPSVFLRPSSMEQTVEPPTATKRQMAMIRFISGKVTARPEMARGPTPCPI